MDEAGQLPSAAAAMDVSRVTRPVAASVQAVDEALNWAVG